MEHLPEILTLADAAVVLRCSKTHVAKIVRGKVANVPALPVVSLGRRKLIRREVLLAWISRVERVPAGATMASSLEVDASGRA